MQSVSSHDLAAALAERLNPHVPDGFVVRVRGPELLVLHHGELVGISGAPQILETVEALHDPAANLETAIWAALSAVEDYIADVTTDPWPGTGREQPNPDARVDARGAELWFGEEDRPVLRFPFIALPPPTAPPAPGR